MSDCGLPGCLRPAINDYDLTGYCNGLHRAIHADEGQIAEWLGVWAKTFPLYNQMPAKRSASETAHDILKLAASYLESGEWRAHLDFYRSTERQP